MNDLNNDNNPGTLLLVATPIGNLKDITLRALETLNNVDLIAAEDTRTSGVLLKHHGITTRMISYHDFNKEKVSYKLVEKLASGMNIALISDAGTPGISDPAFYLVREAIKNNICVSALPGPTAFVPALIISGLPTDRFVFEGFLPVKKGRQTRFLQIAEESRTVIIYESPYRLKRTLSDLEKYCGDRPLVIARELTKKFESCYFSGLILPLLMKLLSRVNLFLYWVD